MGDVWTDDDEFRLSYSTFLCHFQGVLELLVFVEPLWSSGVPKLLVLSLQLDGETETLTSNPGTSKYGGSVSFPLNPDKSPVVLHGGG